MCTAARAGHAVALRCGSSFAIYDGLPTALRVVWLALTKASFPSVLVPLARAESNFARRTLVVEKPGEQREHRSVTAEPLTPAVATTTSQKTCAARFGLSAFARALS